MTLCVGVVFTALLLIEGIPRDMWIGLLMNTSYAELIKI